MLIVLTLDTHIRKQMLYIMLLVKVVKAPSLIIHTRNNNRSVRTQREYVCSMDRKRAHLWLVYKHKCHSLSSNWDEEEGELIFLFILFFSPFSSSQIFRLFMDGYSPTCWSSSSSFVSLLWAHNQFIAAQIHTAGWMRAVWQFPEGSISVCRHNEGRMVNGGDERQYINPSHLKSSGDMLVSDIQQLFLSFFSVWKHVLSSHLRSSLPPHHSHSSSAFTLLLLLPLWTFSTLLLLLSCCCRCYYSLHIAREKTSALWEWKRFKDYFAIKHHIRIWNTCFRSHTQ